MIKTRYMKLRVSLEFKTAFDRYCKNNHLVCSICARDAIIIMMYSGKNPANVIDSAKGSIKYNEIQALRG